MAEVLARQALGRAHITRTQTHAPPAGAIMPGHLLEPLASDGPEVGEAVQLALEGVPDRQVPPPGLGQRLRASTSGRHRRPAPPRGACQGPPPRILPLRRYSAIRFREGAAVL